MFSLGQAFTSVAALISSIGLAASPDATTDSNQPSASSTEIGIPDEVDADVSKGVMTTRLQPKPWQANPSDLIKVAETYTIEGDVIRATLPNGAGVAMRTDSAQTIIPGHQRSLAPSSMAACTQSITAYEPSVYGSQTRGTAAFYSSSGCSDDGYVTTELWGRNCNLGCHWHLKSYSSATAYAGSTRYVTDFHCRDGSHDWHTSGDNFGGLGRVDSSVRYLTNFC